MTARALIFISTLLFSVSIMTPANAITVEIFFDSDEWVKEGKRAIQEGRLEKAAIYYEKALKKKGDIGRKDMIQLRSDLCVAYMYMDRFEEAETQCKIGLDLMPNRWQTLNNLGTVYLLQGEYEKAMISYKRALGMNPKSAVLNKNWEIALQRAEAAKDVPPISSGGNNPGHPINDIDAKAPSGK